LDQSDPASISLEGVLPVEHAALLDVTVRIDRRTTVVLAGEIDASNADALRSVLHHLLDAGARSIRLDCSELSYLDAAMLRVIAETLHRLDRRGGDLTLIGMSGLGRRLLALTGLADRTSCT
jgi:anti-anti-sigma factor